MGLQVRYFMPKNSVAPLAFYFPGDLLSDYTDLELIGTISTMETFQKIYRPEIYNANSAAGQCYQPSLNNQDHSLTKIVYDREERSRLAIEQGNLRKSNLSSPTSPFLNNGLLTTRFDSLKYRSSIMKILLPTSTAGSLPKPSWLAQPETLWSPWKLQNEELIEGKQDALRLSLAEQQQAGIDIVSDGEQTRQHFVTTFIEHLSGVDFEKREVVKIRNRYEASVPTVVGAVARQKPVFVEDAKFYAS